MLVAVFFVTSADSGSLVIDTLASGGAEDTPRWQRIYWCVLLGVTAALLLVAGGLGALQAATLMAALPFCFIMLLLAIGLIRQTKADLEGTTISQEAPAFAERLKRLFIPASRADIADQIASNGEPALMSVRDALLEEGWTTNESAVEEGVIVLTVGSGDDDTFIYRLAPRARPLAAYTALDASEARRPWLGQWQRRRTAKRGSAT